MGVKTSLECCLVAHTTPCSGEMSTSCRSVLSRYLQDLVQMGGLCSNRNFKESFTGHQIIYMMFMY